LSKTSIHCAVHDVLIRLMSNGRDRGRITLLPLAANNQYSISKDNHVIPMLEQVVHGDMKFAVFPLMSTLVALGTITEVFDVVEQIFEMGNWYGLFPS